MNCLDEAIPQIQKFLTILSQALNVEAAVFDSNCQLVVYTPKYIQHKGRHVHAPSLEEVFAQDDIFVNKPGHMPSCAGCRFRDQCPSTIELLHSIKINDQPIGAISLTSFSMEGQKRINKNFPTYNAVLRDAAELIIALVNQDRSLNKLTNSIASMQSIMDFSTDCIFFVDNTGSLIYSNPSALQMFPQCFSYPKLLHHLLPKEILTEILDGKLLSNKTIKSDNLHATLSCLPIKSRNHFIGAVIQINQLTKAIDTKKLELLGSSSVLHEIKGTSEAITTLKDKIKRIAASKSTVLITGETGTGKELLAKAIHHTSSRAASPLISINCATIPENLFESELFGYEEGAFTGSKKGGKPGLIELANRGTLFLDEIGEMPKYMQAKLLRVLQDQTVTRVGGIRPISLDVRIIAATNQDIANKQDFRADLYYRLNVIPLYIPPLRHRKEDIELLANYFLTRFNVSLGRRITAFSPEVMLIFKTYNWPGNIRELENAIEYAVNMEPSNTITTFSLPESFIKPKLIATSEIKDKITSLEADMIRATLDKYGWDLNGKTKTAKELGISLRTLYRKLNVLKSEMTEQGY